MARQLKDVGEELSEVMIMAKILGILPQKFSPLITAWDSVSQANQINNLIKRLLTKEKRLSNFTEATTALAAVKIHKKSGVVHDASLRKETQATKPRSEREENFCRY